MNRLLVGLLAALFFGTCGTNNIVTIDENYLEERQLDTLVVSAPVMTEEEKNAPKTYQLPVYNETKTQLNDLLHTKLELSFDWEKEQVIGKATLQLKPYFYPTNQLVLDAKDFDFQMIEMDGKALSFDNTGQEVYIQLPRLFTREESYTVTISYTATPASSGGSDAITSDQGLFFINPRGEEGDKPQQIWTQGETENSSRWFPTIDSPNERCTQEIYLTVDDRFKTLSNGLLIESTKLDDGKRTDYWRMDLPHAPYLFMLTIGEFDIVKDEDWNGVPVDYYMEDGFKEYAKRIFPHTPEMLGFFSEKTGVDFPWPKYSQVAVRDFVSGAMENTTGVIFGEFMLHTERELIDELLNDKIVAHEMFHHWFGDFVTCESWANLTLNEGFANYSEYLWLEHKYGKDEADYHMLQEWNGYFGSAAGGGIHPLIHYGYNDKEDMFDAHSYNKGGSVLHMLRSYLGDDAFFASLEKYLNDNAYSAVEVDELRMAFEDVTGQDLNWFFDQWYLNQGHPVMNIAYEYDETTAEVVMSVEQIQDPETMPAIFQLPVKIAVYHEGQSQPTLENVLINERNQEIRIASNTKPKTVIFDADRTLLGRINIEKTTADLVYQLEHAPRFLDRYEALDLLDVEAELSAQLAAEQSLKDSFYAIRGKALNTIDVENLSTSGLATLREMARSDKHSDVRSQALYLLAELEDKEVIALAKEALNAEPYPVVAAGLEILGEMAPEESMEVLSELEGETNGEIISAIANVYAINEAIDKIPYFENHLTNVDGFNAVDFYGNYQSLLFLSDKANRDAGVEKMKNIAMNMGQSPWRRISATKALSDLRQSMKSKAEDEEKTEVQEKINAEANELRLIIDAIKEAETNEELKSIYLQF